MRRALFILYYFPPAGGIGVQRGLKFIRYLPEFGWRATVLTVRAGAAFPVRDETLLDEIPPDVPVRRTPCPELYGLYRRLSRHAATTDVDTASQSAGEFKPHRRILRALRGALFIPDGRMLWAPHAIRAGRQLLGSAKHEAIFSSGPPFTSHLIARALHRSHGLPWIADYRDPWTQATFYPRRPPIARAIDLRLEASCIREATCTVIVGAGMEAEFRRRYPDLPPQRLRIIPNGYDEADFAAVPYRHPQHLRITHSGSLFYRRIPHVFFEVLREMLETQPAFAARLRLCFAGRVDEAALDLLRQPPFDRVAEVLGQLTHAGSVELLRRSRLLLLCTGTDAQSRNLVTGKVYEYLAAGPPIMALAPRDGDAARLVERTGAGWAHDPDDREGIRRRLNELWRIECEREAEGGTPPDHPPLFGLRRKEPEIALFTRREQTRRLTELFADGGEG